MPLSAQKMIMANEERPEDAMIRDPTRVYIYEPSCTSMRFVQYGSFMYYYLYVVSCERLSAEVLRCAWLVSDMDRETAAVVVAIVTHVTYKKGVAVVSQSDLLVSAMIYHRVGGDACSARIRSLATRGVLQWRLHLLEVPGVDFVMMAALLLAHDLGVTDPVLTALCSPAPPWFPSAS
jgi:hypothetical protein